MNSAPISPVYRSARARHLDLELRPAALSDTASAPAVCALVAWLVCQVGLLLVLPWLDDINSGHTRMAVLGVYWLTFTQVFQLALLETVLLGGTVVGFEVLLQSYCGLPLSSGWALVFALGFARQMDTDYQRRMLCYLLRRGYALFSMAVYATTRTERLQNPYFRWLNRALFRTFEPLRRACAYRLCALNRAARERTLRAGGNVDLA
jgi:hypothetical protein